LCAFGVADFDTLMSRVKDRAPACGVGTIEEVGVACVSPACRYGAAMTGKTLYIDAGYHILG
jgi:enoyl-[acyl-carrier protein] reductase I